MNRVHRERSGPYHFFSLLSEPKKGLCQVILHTTSYLDHGYQSQINIRFEYNTGQSMCLTSDMHAFEFSIYVVPFLCVTRGSSKSELIQIAYYN